MSRIDELIRELCPEGVGNVPLGTFIEEVKARAGLNTALPVYGISNSLGFLPSGEIFNTSRASSDRSGYKVVQPRDVAYNPSRINVGSIAMSRETMPVIVSPMYVVFSIKDGLDPEFLEHFMRSTFFKSQVLANIEVGARFRFTFEAMANVRVSAPPIEVQREIVSILDKFTQLEAELEAELKARRVQYEEIRNNLLNFDQDLSSHPLSDLIQKLCPEGVALQPLGDLSAIKSGEFVKKTEQGPSFPYPVYNGGTTETGFYKKFNSLENSVVISSRGSIGFVNFLSRKFWAGNSCFVIRPHGPDVLDKYLFHFLKSREANLYSLRAVGSIPALNLGPVKGFQIPVPPLEVQREIVSILDKLDALVNDITYGLPAEIAARRKQYEYYRNKLLTFRELDAA